MTAREKLREIIAENRKHLRTLHDIANGRRLDSEFIERNGVVHQYRCCCYCRYGVPDFDDVCSCLHPERLVKSVDGHWPDPRANTTKTDVCSLYDELTPENMDIDY